MRCVIVAPAINKQGSQAYVGPMASLNRHCSDVPKSVASASPVYQSHKFTFEAYDAEKTDNEDGAE